MMTLQKDKRVGKVLFLVEGERDEFLLLHRIFVTLLGYEEIQVRRSCPNQLYVRAGDRNSKIAVVNTRTSNIKSILDSDSDFLDPIFEQLITQCDFNIDNAFTYYLFDRDYRSNKNPVLIRSLLERLCNSQENPDYHRGGMLLMSYPSVEAYKLSGILPDSYKREFSLGKQVKAFIGNEELGEKAAHFSEETILHAAQEMGKYLGKHHPEYDLDSILDNMAPCSCSVFDGQEAYFQKKRTYRLLSLFSIALLDLGILRVEQEI